MPITIRAEQIGIPLTDHVRAFGRWAQESVDAGMLGVAQGLIMDLRQEISAAFPGNRRMPTTVTGDYYPADGGKDPAVLLHPRKGAGLLLSGQTGATIVPKRGKALAIPTRHVPRVERGGRRMTPEQVSARFQEKLDYMPAKPGGKALGYLVLRKQTVGRSGRVRRATAGRARQGRVAKPIVMFILVRAVTMPQRLRPAETMRKWAELAPVLIEQAAARLSSRGDSMASARSAAARVVADVRSLPRSGPFGTPTVAPSGWSRR